MEQPGLTNRDRRWWLAPVGEAHGVVLHVVKSIRQDQEAEKIADVLHESLYGNMPRLGFGMGPASRKSALGASRLSLNVVRNMVGAVTSKIAAKNKPKPTFLTEEGNYEQRDKAEKLEKFVGGVFYESGVYAELTKCFRDACVHGTSFLKIYPSEGRVEVARVSKPEMVVDPDEARYGTPQNLYERRYYDTLKLIEMATEWHEGSEEELAVKVAAIEAAANARDPDDIEYAYRATADQVLVTEAYHLGPTKKKPGRHVVCIEGASLLDEPWDGPFPYAVLRWTEATEGYFGVGLAEELMGIQAEINKLLQQIQRGHHLITGHWMVEKSSQTVTATINNDLGAIVKYAGLAPTYQAPAIIAPEVYQHLWQLYAKAFEIAGISQLNATGQKPAGLDSGAAQRAYQDIQTERFLEVGQAYEEFVIEAARLVVRCAKKIGGSYRVRSVGKSEIHIVDWSEIDLDEDLYVIRVYPTSLLPSTPAGRLAWAQDMMNSGVMPPEDVLDVVDFPDTEQYAKRRNASRRVIERNISHMIRKGEFVSPEPFDNHKLALRIVNEAYHEARLDGVPEDRLELLRRYMADTQDFIGSEQPMPGPAPVMPPMPMDPMGAPMPPAGPPPMPPGPPMAPPMAA